MAPIVKRIQGIYGVVETAGDANKLHYLFANTLGLPEDFAPADHGSFRGGGVYMGNVWLKFLTFHPKSYLMSSKPGKLQILEMQPINYDRCIKEFDKRGISYKIDVSKMPDEAGKETEWGRDVLLQAPLFKEIMLDFSTFTHLAFRSFTSAPEAKDLDDHNRIMRARFDAAGGGLLGAKAVKEIELGVKDVKRDMRAWQTLLSPLEPDGDSWRIGRSPTLRFTSSRDYSIRSVSIGVKSLRTAKKVLRMNGLLGEANENMVALDREKVNGLDIRFVK
jgi:hypothetical protein